MYTYFLKVGRVERGKSERGEGQESGSSSACSGSQTSAALPTHNLLDLPNNLAPGPSPEIKIHYTLSMLRLCPCILQMNSTYIAVTCVYSIFVEYLNALL